MVYFNKEEMKLAEGKSHFWYRTVHDTKKSTSVRQMYKQGVEFALHQL
jgi:hypothetical protein